MTDTRHYKTNFTLTGYVNDYDAAADYLTCDDMTQYVKYASGSSKLEDVVTKIEWILVDEGRGYIEVETNRALTPQESQDLSDWIRGQNSDGLGEGFEQQDFATERCECDECYEYGEWGEDAYGDHDGMVSFDWHSNNYELVEIF